MSPSKAWEVVQNNSDALSSKKDKIRRIDIMASGAVKFGRYDRAFQ
jgi:hypothetical protein